MEAAAGISIVAVHEAGHAVARFWTAKIMGYDPAEAVASIEMHRPDTAPKYLGADGNWYIHAATTFGPWFSKPIAAASKDVAAHYGIEGINARPEEYAADVMAAARAAGADIAGWVNAKMLQAVAGPVAEAKATGTSRDDMLSAAEFAPDFADAANPGRIAGWSEQDISHGIANAVAIVEQELSAPQAWNALLALATSLPHEGTIDGRTCWTIFVRAFEKRNRLSSDP